MLPCLIPQVRTAVSECIALVSLFRATVSPSIRDFLSRFILEICREPLEASCSYGQPATVQLHITKFSVRNFAILDAVLMRVLC